MNEVDTNIYKDHVDDCVVRFYFKDSDGIMHGPFNTFDDCAEAYYNYAFPEG